MAKNLVIVESPTKVRTIKKFLGKDFQIKATVGHIKNLPRKRLGVDIEHNFKPEYVMIKKKSSVLKEIKKAAQEADKIYLAPDPDREGEAIAWHVAQELNGRENIYRVLFNEITRNAVLRALESPGRVDQDKVNAQQARRILDRLVGYKISPLLWKKVRKGLSAGRVQSVAVRLICERETEIKNFTAKEYWSISAKLAGRNPPPFSAEVYKYKTKRITINNETQAKEILADLEGKIFQVTGIQKKERRKNPSPPFITSSLQQEASRRFRFSASFTMSIAQRLYEGIELGSAGPLGLITYMRTDSTRIAPEAIQEVRRFIEKEYGSEFLPAAVRAFKTKKMAQEAHEAIRPTSLSRSPDFLKPYLSQEQYRLYNLIYQRFVASQMEAAVFDLTRVEIMAGDYGFKAVGSRLKFSGFTRIYQEEKEFLPEEQKKNKGEETGIILPALEKDEVLKLLELNPEQHFTQPPPRYSEATLIKALEEKGVGRPSTYALILETIRDRDYVSEEKRRFIPTDLGFLITDLLVKNFPRILDLDFTARMEDGLDKIEEGKKNWVKTLEEFYASFEHALREAEEKMKNVKQEAVPTEEVCSKCGSPMVIRWGRFGKFLACSGYPRCKNTQELQEKDKEEKDKQEFSSQEVCKKCGAELLLKRGKFGRFLACSKYPQCNFTQALSLGVKCPEEGCEGVLRELRTKKGRIFYGCSSYPACKFSLWNKPLAEKCPACGGLLVEKNIRGKGKLQRCYNKECGYEGRAE